MQKIKHIINTKLDERERMIINLRYGLIDERGLTQKEVAEKLGISRSYISRIENKALEVIKENFQEEDNKNKNTVEAKNIKTS